MDELPLPVESCRSSSSPKLMSPEAVFSPLEVKVMLEPLEPEEPEEELKDVLEPR